MTGHIIDIMQSLAIILLAAAILKRKREIAEVYKLRWSDFRR